MNEYSIFEAARENWRSLVRKLLENGAYVNDADEKGRTPLMYAAYENATPVMNLLLGEYDADTEQEDAKGRTALMYAASHNSVDAINLLLQFQANVNAQDEDGHTALIYAICEDAPEAAKILIDNSDYDARDNDGWSAYMWAVVKKATEISDILKDYGVKLDPNDISKILDEPAFASNPFDIVRKKNILSPRRTVSSSRRDYSKYCFNGMIAGKAPTVYEVVKYYVLHNSGLTYRDLISAFPDYLCPNGVIKKIEDIYSGDLGVRYNKTPIMLDDGTEVAVSNQWTKYTFENNFIEAAEKLGLEIEFVIGNEQDDSSLKKQFVNFLQDELGYKPTTATNYASCIEQIQRHYNSNENDNISLFYCDQSDVLKIKSLLTYYDYGKYDDFSQKANQRKNALKAFIKFLDYKYPKPQRPKAVLIKKNRQDIE